MKYDFFEEDCYEYCNEPRYPCNCQKIRYTPFIPKNYGNRNVFAGGANAPNRYKYNDAFIKNVVINSIDEY